SFAGGMETLPAALAEWLRRQGVEFRTARIDRLARDAEGWSVTTAAATGEQAVERAAAVILATPAQVAGRLVAALDAVLAADLCGIEYAGSVIVSLGFRRQDVAHPLDAAGLVVPRAAGRRALAVSFSSSKFPGRAPAGHVLMRVFLGGGLDPAAVELDDAALCDLAITEARMLVGATGKPRFQRIDRWASAMPQYHIGHADRVARIEQAVEAHPGLALAGAAYRGVGIPQVIASGQAAARQALAATPQR
ncbi:MAG: Protoporphyrinogen oxidase, partial [Planctomycetota bacterium]